VVVMIHWIDGLIFLILCLLMAVVLVVMARKS
jgi:hypothetical protein